MSDSIQAGGIRQMAERHWNGEGDLVGDEHPVRPALGRAAEEITPGILTFISVASVNAIDSADGLVMLDTGGQFDSDHLYDVVRAWRPDDPLTAAVYSHHHIDHVFGTRRFEAEAAEKGWAPPTVYAHEDLPDHSSLTKIRQRLPHSIHEQVFGVVLQLAEDNGLFPGHTVGVDSTFLEANAAMKTIVECLRMLAYLIGLAFALVNAMPPVGR
jgi:hypothetical protein